MHLHLLKIAYGNPYITERLSISLRINAPGYIRWYIMNEMSWCHAVVTRTTSCIDMNQTVFDEFKPVVISVVIVMNITLNVLVIAVIAKYPQLREDRTTLFIFSLTLSDLANGCTAMPISAAVCSNATPNVRNMLPYVPRVLQVFSVWFNFTSLHSLCWVTVCKMIAITKPLRYEQLLTRNRCYLIIVCTWLASGIFAISLAHLVTKLDLVTCMYGLPTISDSIWYVVFGIITGSLLPITAIVYATIKILCVIVRTHHQITSQVNSISGFTDNTHSATVTLKAIRSGKSVLIICLAFLIITFPLDFYSIVYMVGLENRLPLSFSFVANWIFLCNSSVNSLLYLVLFHSVRSKTAEMISNCCLCLSCDR